MKDRKKLRAFAWGGTGFWMTFAPITSKDSRHVVACQVAALPSASTDHAVRLRRRPAGAGGTGATRPFFPSWSPATGRGSSASAAACWAISNTPRTPSRRRSSSWPARQPKCVGRNTIRGVLRQADLTWKKKLLSKAKPEKHAAHVQELLKLFARACGGEVLLIYVDEVPVHRDLDLGYSGGRRGERIWRKSDCPKLQDRMNAYALSKGP